MCIRDRQHTVNKNNFTTTYHPQANGQVERYNRTILAALRTYVADHPRDWDLYTDELTYAYNCLPHTSTDVAPFDLVLSKPPGPLALKPMPTKEDIITLVHYFCLLPKPRIVVTFVTLLGLQKSCPCSRYCPLESMFPLSFEVTLCFFLCGHRFQGQGPRWFGQT